MTRSVCSVACVCACAACACVVALSTAACNTEHLEQLHARIAVCAHSDDKPSACAPATTTPLDIGDVPGGIAFAVDVFALDRGNGALSLRSIDTVGATTSDVVSVDVAHAPTTTAGALPADLKPGGAAPITLHFDAAPDPLGPRTVGLRIKSDDDTHATIDVFLAYNVVPPPHPVAQWCNGPKTDATRACASDGLDVDVGNVRPTESKSVALYVSNAGDAPLHIAKIDAPPAGDIAVTSSTKGAVLAPGDEAPVIVTYTPSDAGDDAADIAIESDDASHPQCIAHVHGSGGTNQAPTAVALDSVTHATSTTVKVGDEVGVLGGGSSDPEGDPLVFQWTLTSPSGSNAAIVDATAENAVFTPDVRGTYSVALVVADSLGQTSAPATVTVTANPHFAFRARTSWSTGGDVDVHLVKSGSAPFSSDDCTYDNRDVDGDGDPATSSDDAVLLDDATTPGSSESAVIEAPLAGTWEVWLAYFDEAGAGDADATIDIIANDDATPIATLSTTLHATCDLWHAFDVDPANGTATSVNAPIVSQCPP